jgi:hypothetical protein
MSAGWIVFFIGVLLASRRSASSKATGEATNVQGTVASSR